MANAAQMSAFETRLAAGRVRDTRRAGAWRFALAAASADLAAILSAGVVAGLGYNVAVYGAPTLSASSLGLSGFVALAYLAANALRRNFAPAHYLAAPGHWVQAMGFWNLAFLLAAFLGFLQGGDPHASRGAFVAFYVGGLGALAGADALMARLARAQAGAGRLQGARVMIVGFGPEFERLARRADGRGIVDSFVLSGEQAALDDELAAALGRARRKAPDEILIAAPQARADVLGACVRAFSQVPAVLDVHLEPGAGLAAFAGGRVVSAGGEGALRLPGRSPQGADVWLKRGFDIAVAAAALVLALPLMLGVALAIKWESSGPVFFTQVRHGYNKKPFRIFKFRTMTAREGGRRVAQATRNDFRVTRMGRWMRRFNIDELPQLVNVLRGEMSLVGPRPHALAHDRQFARAIEVYDRRHNLKPGITGWAQVHGLRGPTDTQDKIEQRVAFDLHYVDHWTLGLDLWILFRTLFSRMAYRNAF